MRFLKYMVAFALIATASAAWAGWNITQNDDGSMCWNDSSTIGDAWCIDIAGALNSQANIAASADSATTNDAFEIAFTTPVDTTGTNTHNALTLDLAIGNATGGTNTVNALQIDAISGDAEVTLNAINIGALTGTGATEVGINIGTGWDDGVLSGSNMTLDDGTTDSPSITLQDATNETAVILKVDSGNMTITTVAADGVEIVTGNLIISNGTPGSNVPDGEDLYVEGTVEVDGVVQFDGAVTIAGGLIRTGFETVHNIADQGSTGTDWVIDPLLATGVMATLAQSLTAEIMIVPISGLHVGDTITGFKVHAQVESGGNTVTIDGDLRNIDNTAADPVDASIGTITQVSVTADTAVAASVGSLSHVVLATDSYYIRITATTGATTDIQMINVTVTVTKS